MIIERLTTPGLAIHSYLVGCPAAGEAVLIDPTRHVGGLMALAERHRLRITHSIDTHVHADFLSGGPELKAILGDALTIHSSGLGGEEWTQAFADNVLADGDSVQIGSIRLVARHSPGHTPEHIVLELYDLQRSAQDPWLLFSGDLLFVGSVGRPDLLGEQARALLATQLYDTLFERLSGLPDFTEILPAHGAGSLCGKGLGGRASSTLGYERRTNPALRQLQREAWIDELMQGMPAAPPYFANMKRINRVGPALLGDLNRPLHHLGEDVLNDPQLQFVDIRTPEQYMAGHLPGSFSLPVDSGQANWAGWSLDPGRPIVLLADNAHPHPAARRALELVGFDNIAGVLDPASLGPRLRSALLLTGSDSRLAEGSAQIVDVRSADEFEAGHIPGAVNIETAELVSGGFGNLDPQRTQILVCEGGVRAAVAASALARRGFSSYGILEGGMKAWREGQRTAQPLHS
ncbi:MBL fold metallo-hydrolase [bacterium]|nr:MBL fold metallo-hydrolase [bacterium]